MLDSTGTGEGTGTATFGEEGGIRSSFRRRGGCESNKGERRREVRESLLMWQMTTMLTFFLNHILAGILRGAEGCRSGGKGRRRREGERRERRRGSLPPAQGCVAS